MSHRTTAEDTTKMPSGIPYIVGNEVAERFSFYGMKTILAVFITQYLWLMNDGVAEPINEAKASTAVHWFGVAVYITPFIGALLADLRFGKYRVILWLSLIYCLGHAALAFIGNFGESASWLIAGLALIAIGSGGIKPCVSAHVGDQFCKKNQTKLTAVYNIFYFSINLGAFVSSLLTPWVLEWYGPHWAFGIPGALMAIATIIFWMGRKKFAHLPANTKLVSSAIKQKDFWPSMLRISSIFAFVTIFWALFEQTGTTWVFQAQDMDRNFLGIEWLKSQIQAFNPILILIFIPLFTFVLYPLLNRVFPLTPLRKIGIGLFLMTACFGLVSIIQEWIDQGQEPNISWQLLAYALLTASEVMVSIVSLEFAFTQAPPNTKSIVMSMWLGAVALGNFVTVKVNDAIYSEDPLESYSKNKTATKLIHPGYDQSQGTLDDLTVILKDDSPNSRSFAATKTLKEASQRIINFAQTNGQSFPSKQKAAPLLQDLKDPWGKAIRLKQLNRYQARISSDGPDGIPQTKWDTGYIIKFDPNVQQKGKKRSSFLSFLEPTESWITKRKKELGIDQSNLSDTGNSSPYSLTAYTGGVSKLEGASYFWFFTYLMLGCSIIFIPFAHFYRYQKYHDAE